MVNCQASVKQIAICLTQHYWDQKDKKETNAIFKMLKITVYKVSVYKYTKQKQLQEYMLQLNNMHQDNTVANNSYILTGMTS